MDKTDIIKALEIHRRGLCDECPYEDLPRCLDILCENTVKFINELTEENERLSGAVKQYEEERKYHFEMSRTRIAEAKADTVRKMADSIKLEFYREFDEIIPSIMADRIDQIAKEMLEGV